MALIVSESTYLWETFYQQTFRIGPYESAALHTIAQFFNTRFEKPSRTLHNLTSAVLSVEPKKYFTSPVSMSPAVRTLIERFCTFYAFLDQINECKQILILEPTIESFDIFTGETNNSGIALFASSDQTCGTMDLYTGSATDWLYHILVNGFVHPMTREPIRSFGTIEYFTGSSLEATVVHSIPPRPVAHEIMNEQFEFPMALDNMPVYFYDLILFEEEYGIPQDRTLSAYYHAPPVPIEIIDLYNDVIEEALLVQINSAINSAPNAFEDDETLSQVSHSTETNFLNA